MVFSNLNFIFIFLPVFFAIYYVVPYKMKNLTIVAGSLLFYFIGCIDMPEHLVIFISSIAVDYYAGIYMETNAKYKKQILVASIVFHIICLVSFKYSNFVLGQLNTIYFDNKFIFNIVQPIGISFYTFQGISYLADVYKGKIKAEKNLTDFAAYIAMFEQLIAGPIVTYDSIEKDLHKRVINIQNVKSGVTLFIIGLGLKVLLANPIGKLWTQVEGIGFESISTPLAWLAIFAYTFQIFFDFFGYSLMAIGLGKLLGFKIPENFRFPYISRSMTEFWRRWHITLGSWFREYIYIPLGGNRKGTICTIRNLLIVWLLTGIWHGAGYNFIIWGLVIFMIIVIEKYAISGFLEKHIIISHLYMILLIPVTWAIFAIDDTKQLGIFFTRLFPVGNHNVWSQFRYDYIKYISMYYPFFIAGVIFSTPIPFRLFKQLSNRAVRIIILALIFIASVYCLYRGLDDPFLYFRF